MRSLCFAALAVIHNFTHGWWTQIYFSARGDSAMGSVGQAVAQPLRDKAIAYAPLARPATPQRVLRGVGKRGSRALDVVKFRGAVARLHLWPRERLLL